MWNTMITTAKILTATMLTATLADAKIIANKDPLIYYHGRWDASPGTWWATSGFKLHLSILGHTTAPFAFIGVSLDYQDFFTVNVSAGVNGIPLSGLRANGLGEMSTSIVRINVEGWQIIINDGAVLLPYKPSRLAFQFIGDSLSAGQFLPKGINQAWHFLAGERFEAEHRINAQPGAALSDIFSLGNAHGASFQFFRTEDTGYYYTTDHNFTTPWNFARDEPPATHIVIHIGYTPPLLVCISDDRFVQVYSDFLTRLRAIYPRQPIFVFTPWGWPSADGSISQYYQGQYQKIIEKRHAIGDQIIFLVDTTGWVTFADVFPDNVHPDLAGHTKIADKFEEWLEEWGLVPETRWTEGTKE